ncbi:hypothetical protein G7072_06755 [Nocardioides sp. HDW12B]|uniref:pilus assembly protein TadG-related protein n=1 Tax=Nocardioides sp. HDW12B TaxID=2714939 RepID=UPI00140C4C10|nr:pilus assembly protein TadG-related protein [Nocardioides sp. HDW12B]QIK66081.1 hypothetical protein G7072_06755 [Nocardioides sp. HDW12B]
MSRRRPAGENGAVAIVVALSATMLFAIAAIAVDLGNAFAARRDLQTQADLAATSAAGLLPKGDATNQANIVAEVANYLNRNKAGVNQSSVTSTQLTDTQLSNGEVTFPTDNQVRVVTPSSRVDFGVARAIGISSKTLDASATAEKRALVPPTDDVLPMWLPSSCAYGAVGGDTGPGPTTPAANPTYDPGNSNVDSKFHITAISVNTAPFGTTTGSIDVTLTNEDSAAIGTPAAPKQGAIVFTFGAPTSWTTATTVYPVNLAIPGKSGSTLGTQTVTIPGVGSEVTNTVGKWEVWGAYNATGGKVVPGTTKFSADPNGANAAEPLAFTVTGGGGEVACNVSQRGNFGQLDSPRAGYPQLQKRYEYNLALGLDHKLAPFNMLDYPAIATNPECFNDGSPTGAKIDNVVRDGNNCIYVQSGNDPGGLTSGFLTGVDGGPDGAKPGRLFTAPTSSRCTTNGRVAPAKASDSKVAWANINRDTLSCFLLPGKTLADIASDTAAADIVDRSILQSPRYFQVPVVHANDRADKKYIAIKQYASVFLTDETPTCNLTAPTYGGPGCATAENGITMNGGGNQVFAVQVFAFNTFAITTPPNGADTEWFVGGKPVIRLVD